MVEDINKSRDNIASKRAKTIEEIIKNTRNFDDHFILVATAEINAQHTSKVLKYLAENLPLQNFHVRFFF
jgi:ATP-dependent protease HslVU (ClpYQ) ATPase subunit